MANFWFPHALHQIGSGALNLGTQVLGVTLNEDVNTLRTDGAGGVDHTQLSGITTPNYHPNADFAANKQLANVQFLKDAANNRSELTADPTVFTSLPNSGEDVGDAMVYARVTDETDSYGIAAFDTQGFPFTPTGSDNTINWNAEGVLQLASAGTP